MTKHSLPSTAMQSARAAILGAQPQGLGCRIHTQGLPDGGLSLGELAIQGRALDLCAGTYDAGRRAGIRIDNVLGGLRISVSEQHGGLEVCVRVQGRPPAAPFQSKNSCFRSAEHLLDLNFS